MVHHPAPGKNFPAATLNFVGQPSTKPLIMSLIVKQLSAAISTSDDMVVSTGELQPWFPSHDVSNIQNYFCDDLDSPILTA